MPEFDFPAFPVPDGNVLDEENGTVVVSLDWYCAVAEYKADVDALEKEYESLKVFRGGQ